MRYKAFNYWSEDCPVEWDYDDTYEILVDTKTNEVVCFLSEPEDRTFGRDLKKLVDLLNKPKEDK